MRSQRGILLLVALMLAVGCRARPITTVSPAHLAGTYQFQRAGRNMGHSWSIRSTLTLSEPDTYSLDHVLRNDGEEKEESQSGKFWIEGTVLLLRSDRNERADLRISGDSLVAKLDWPGRWFARWAGGAPVYVRRQPT